MRRLLLTLAAGLTVTAVVAVAAHGGQQPYRVAAVFDTADGIAAGFVVKVAGVEVGKVTDVSLTEDLKARVELEVEPQFGPFRADAACRILPESLISEKFIACEAGTAAQPLAGKGDARPTIAVANTSVPVAVQDILDIFAAPTSERLRLLLNELGITVAARAEDLNTILRRSNPALEDAQRTLAIIDGQRAELATAVAQTDTVVAELADRRSDVTNFIAATADVASIAAERRAELGAAVRDLPPLLRATTSTLGELGRAADVTTPLVGAVREAAPSLNQLLARVPSFTADAGPAIDALAAAARAGSHAVPPTAPVARQLARVLSGMGEPVTKVKDTLVSLRDQGAIEGLGRFLYAIASVTSNYDSLSHLDTAQLTATPCILAPETEGCDGTYYGQATKAAPTRKRTAHEPRTPRPRPTRPERPAPTVLGVPVPTPEPPKRPAGPVDQLVPQVEKLVDSVEEILKLPGQVVGDGRAPADIKPLLDYLLGK